MRKRVVVGKAREAAHHVREAVGAARAEQAAPAIEAPQLAAEQLELAALTIWMRGFEPAVGDGDDGKQPVGVALAADKARNIGEKGLGEAAG